MELTQHLAETTQYVTVQVNDGIVIKSVHNKDMKITGLVLTYTIDGEQWVSRAVTVKGYRIKQNGEPGLKADDKLFGWPEQYPEWVAKAAEHYRPKAAAPLPAVPTCVLDVEEA